MGWGVTWSWWRRRGRRWRRRITLRLTLSVPLCGTALRSYRCGIGPTLPPPAPPCKASGSGQALRVGSGQGRGLGGELGEDLLQLGVDAAVGGGDFFPAQAEGHALEVGHHAARFAHQQDAGAHVPGLQIEFPEAVEAPGGDVAEVEGGRAVA